MTVNRTPARSLWRITRLAARHMDRTIPFWWRDDRVMEALRNNPNDIVTRCWRELVRQRTGE